MWFVKHKQVDISRDLPADILSAYLRHHVQVNFEHGFSRSHTQTEPSFEILVSWCESHCESVYSALPVTREQAQFRFYLHSDLDAFYTFLNTCVASDQSDPT